MAAAIPDPEALWTTLGRSPAYLGRVRIVLHDVRLPSGALTSYEVDESVPFAVAVLLQQNGELLLARQYRYPIDRWILDLPGGAGEPGETPEQAARRECEEEFGLVPDDLLELHTFFPDPGRAAWPVHLYFARATTAGRRRSDDESEQVRLIRLTCRDLDSRVAAGVVVDPSLLIARAMAAVRGWLPPITTPKPPR